MKIVKETALIIIAVLLIRTFGAMTVRVTGASMAPALRDGQYLLVERVSYRFRAPRPGEVVVFFTPPAGHALIKRAVYLRQDGLFVRGDNRAQSRDSRHFGAVPYKLLAGRAVWCYWPISKWGAVETIAPTGGRGTPP